jgi:hypothetical protein
MAVPLRDDSACECGLHRPAAIVRRAERQPGDDAPGRHGGKSHPAADLPSFRRWRAVSVQFAVQSAHTPPDVVHGTKKEMGQLDPPAQVGNSWHSLARRSRQATRDDFAEVWEPGGPWKSLAQIVPAGRPVIQSHDRRIHAIVPKEPPQVAVLNRGFQPNIESRSPFFPRKRDS